VLLLSGHCSLMCDLFSNAVSRSDFLTSNIKMINE
jgi:hypothetical protein